MKKWLRRTLMLLAILLAACAPRVYGVPQERWETMSEQERVAAMEAYKARQEVLRQQREERARRQAMERQAQLAREAEEAHRRQLQVDAIYRGEGLYGELLRVRVEGGMVQFYGDHKPYHPVSFRIAASEMKEVEIVSTRGHKVRLAVQYDGSNLLLDERPRSHRSTALRLAYEDSWEPGDTYSNLFSKGPLELRGVSVSVQIVGRPPRDHGRRRHRPKVIVVQSPARKPHKPEVIVVQPPARKPHKPEVIVIREPAYRPKPDVVVIENRPQPKKPEIIVIKSQPETDMPGRIVEHRPVKRREPAAHASGPPRRIKVAFRNGYIKSKRHREPLIPQSIELREGDARNVVIRGKRGNLKIRVSYQEGELLINDAPGRGKKHTRLGFVQGWKAGQPYAIQTSSNHLLEDLDVVVESQ